MPLHQEELSVWQFAQLVGRPRWVVRGWCAAGLLPSRLTGQLNWRVKKTLAAEYARGQRSLPDGQPITSEALKRLVGAAVQLLGQGLPEEQRAALVRMVDEASKEISQQKG